MTTVERSRRPRVGLVLSGGGARGAYEAGVLQYLRVDLPRRLGRQLPVDIVSGTSVGAIHSAFLAATMDDAASQGDRLVAHWSALRLEDILGVRRLDLAGLGRLLMGNREPLATVGDRHGGILDTSALERFVVNNIPWRGIERNLRAGMLEAVSVSATCARTGDTVVFVSSTRPLPPAGGDPRTRTRATRIGPRHVLGSAAIPLLFPAVRNGAELLLDGGLRQNTPLSPAILLGADRILVVSLRRPADPVPPSASASTLPGPLSLAVRMLDSLLGDDVEHDLAQMRQMNALLEAGEAAFGLRFQERLGQELARLRGAPMRSIETAHLRPSVDLGALAADLVARGKVAPRGRLVGRLVQRLAASNDHHEHNLLSFLLFDRCYAAALIDLGRSDAARHEEALTTLFGDAITADRDPGARARPHPDDHCELVPVRAPVAIVAPARPAACGVRRVRRHAAMRTALHPRRGSRRRMRLRH